MSLLTLVDGRWELDYEAEPIEYWPYTTIVYDVVLTGSRSEFKALENHLLKLFKDNGIRAYAENKCAYGVKFRDRMWYLGFKDGRFDLGLSVKSDTWVTPTRKDTAPKATYE